MSETFTQSTRPLWFDTASIPKFPEATSDITVDVCIVGGGITGLTAADLLKRAGKTVAVVELSRVGAGETGHTTAHLTEVFDLDYRDLISNFGLEGAQLAAQSVRRSIQKIEDNVIAKQIDCGFQRVSGWQYTEKRAEVEQLEAEAEAALRAGVPNELVYETPFPRSVARAIRFDHQAQFQPLKYLAALARSVDGGGSYIFENTRMLDIHDGEPCRVTTDRGTITAKDVIVAAHVPSSNRFFLHTKIAAYRTYAVAARIKDGDSKRFTQNLYWDIDDPYHYIRSAEFNGIPHLIIGGEDHKTGQGENTALHFQKLEDWAHERFDVESFSHRWSGQIEEPVDGLPFIGKNSMSDHVYVATGYSGTGMTFGTVAGMLISDLILDIKNPWAQLYEAGRVKPLASIRSFISENIDFPSHLIGDRFTPAQENDINRLKENEGAIVRIGGKKVAAYRDPNGELSVLSPVCPHMGCYVHWNEAETSWDCPCHGSRFGPKGQLLNGPAVTDLASEEYDENAPMIPERYENPLRPNDPFSPPIMSFMTCPFKAKPT